MSNFIKRELADKAPKRGSRIERLLNGFARNAQRAEQREEAQEGQEESAPRGLPRGFAFRRRMNH